MLLAMVPSLQPETEILALTITVVFISSTVQVLSPQARLGIYFSSVAVFLFFKGVLKVSKVVI